ncbi:GRAS family transcription factor [Rhynchospora pubera]|uniref:GRAS family transcription factor n=1 Tax=Rhynchospora pubera TaxID=906938 RepID=A0AAV8HGM5_9POAL|nr:GRAS family transcription factor [Rhynchospora pubera]
MKSTKTTNNNTATPFPSPLSYEPTSVLDPRATSSPASALSATTADPCNIIQPSNPLDESDALSWLLYEKDNLSPPLKPYHHNFTDDLLDPFQPQITSFTHEYNHLELLIQASHLIDTGDLQSAHQFLARLNQYFPSPSGVPIHRAAFYFKEALLSALSLHDRPAESPLSAVEVVCRINAQRLFADLSPIPRFASFAANQSILEALDTIGQPPPSIHVIDFDLGLGGQWSSFSQAVAARSCLARLVPPAIRLTAVVQNRTPETTLAAENLCDFAQSLGLRFSVDIVCVAGIGFHALGRIQLIQGEPVAVVLSPAKVCIKSSGTDTYKLLQHFLQIAVPRVVVLLDTDCFNPTSLSQSVASGLEFYGSLIESVEAAAASTGMGEEAVRRVEWGIFRPKISEVVGSWCGQSEPFHEMLAGSRLTPVGFSQNVVAQAEWLVRGASIDGYQVARRDASLVLSWHGKDLVVTSAWRS